MVKDLTDSIKARLYDFQYTPFMGSILISWIILNHKYLLIYFADYTLDKKLLIINKYDFAYYCYGYTLPFAFNFFFPIFFGLFYVFIYPRINEKFYKFTEEKRKNLKKIKQDIEDETPLTIAESREIRKVNLAISEEKDKLEEKLANLEKVYEEEIKQEIDMEVKLKTSELNQIITTIKNELLEANKKIKQLDEANKIKDSTSKMIESIQPRKEDDKTKILRYLYNSNYKPTRESDFLDLIVKNTKIPRLKAEQTISQLLKDKYLEKTYMSGFGNLLFMDITQQGKKMMLDLFDKEN